MMLILTVCLLTNPSYCEERRISFAGNEVQCALFWQQRAAEWLETHPGYLIKRGRCGPLEIPV